MVSVCRRIESVLVVMVMPGGIGVVWKQLQRRDVSVLEVTPNLLQ